MLFRTIEVPKGTANLEPVFPSTGMREIIVGSDTDIQNRIAGIGKAVAMQAGAIAFYPEDEFTPEELRKVAARFEAYLLPQMERGVDYDILWGTFSKGGSTELRYVLPLIRRKDQKPLSIPTKLLADTAVWVRVQNLSFGWRDPNPAVRAGVRPDFQFGRSKGALKTYLVDYLEEAVLAGDLSSRDDVIKDLSALGFEVRNKEPHGLTVRYCGDDPEIHKRDLHLEGVIFEQSFGKQDHTVAAEQKAAIADAVKQGIAAIEAAVVAAEKRLGEALINGVTDAVAENVGEVRSALRLVGEEVKERLQKTVEAEVKGHAPLLDETSAKVTELRSRLSDQEARIDTVVSHAEGLRKPFLIGTGIAAALVVLALGTSFLATGRNASAGAKMAGIIERAEQLDEVVLNRLSVFDDAMDTHLSRIDENNEALAAAQAGMAALLDNITDIRNAFAIETKSDGTDVLTIYVRRLQNVRSCDEDPTCVVRVNPSSR